MFNFSLLLCYVGHETDQERSTCLTNIPQYRVLGAGTCQTIGVYEIYAPSKPFAKSEGSPTRRRVWGLGKPFGHQEFQIQISYGELTNQAVEFWYYDLPEEDEVPASDEL